MKKIEAYIKDHRLSEVISKLHEIKGLTGASIHDVKGLGRTNDEGGDVRISTDTFFDIPHVKIEIMCSNEIVEVVVETIKNAAHTGLREDGKIYISNLEDAIRISTGERGEGAI